MGKMGVMFVEDLIASYGTIGIVEDAMCEI